MSEEDYEDDYEDECYEDDEFHEDSPGHAEPMENSLPVAPRVEEESIIIEGRVDFTARPNGESKSSLHSVAQSVDVLQGTKQGSQANSPAHYAFAGARAVGGVGGSAGYDAGFAAAESSLMSVSDSFVANAAIMPEPPAMPPPSMPGRLPAAPTFVAPAGGVGVSPDRGGGASRVGDGGHRHGDGVPSSLFSPLSSPAEASEDDGAAGRGLPAATAASAGGSTVLLPYHTQTVRRGFWKLGKKIGSGTFGTVHQGLNEDNGMAVAVKVLKRAGRDDGAIKELENEIRVMQNLDHPNIVRYLGCQVDADTCYIFQEWVPCGSLGDLLKVYGPLTNLGVLRRYLAQITAGLAYLHDRRIVHRDLKGGNVLVNEFGVCKLADFGCSKALGAEGTVGEASHGGSGVKGTPYFMAPEVIKNDRAGRSSDIWSLGGVVYQMATGDPPWKALNFKTPMVLFYHVVHADAPPPLSPPHAFPPPLAALVAKCFARRPEDRPTAHELLNDPFLLGEEEKEEKGGRGGAAVVQEGGGSGSGAEPASTAARAGRGASGGAARSAPAYAQVHAEGGEAEEKAAAAAAAAAAYETQRGRGGATAGGTVEEGGEIGERRGGAKATFAAGAGAVGAAWEAQQADQAKAAWGPRPSPMSPAPLSPPRRSGGGEGRSASRPLGGTQEELAAIFCPRDIRGSGSSRGSGGSGGGSLSSSGRSNVAGSPPAHEVSSPEPESREPGASRQGGGGRRGARGGGADDEAKAEGQSRPPSGPLGSGGGAARSATGGGGSGGGGAGGGAAARRRWTPQPPGRAPAGAPAGRGGLKTLRKSSERKWGINGYQNQAPRGREGGSGGGSGPGIPPHSQRACSAPDNRVGQGPSRAERARAVGGGGGGGGEEKEGKGGVAAAESGAGRGKGYTGSCHGGQRPISAPEVVASATERGSCSSGGSSSGGSGGGSGGGSSGGGGEGEKGDRGAAAGAGLLRRQPSSLSRFKARFQDPSRLSLRDSQQ